MLVNLKCILDEAYKDYYAVGSFNGYNFETFKGIVEAGAETKTPVILAFGAKYLPNMSVETAAAMAKSLSEEVSIPVCLHLDHCKDQGVVYRALKAGFGSVMYDGSSLPFEENLQNTLDVCRVAHACGASVEAELGSLAAGERSHEGSAGDVEAYTDPEAAKQFVESRQIEGENLKRDLLGKLDYMDSLVDYIGERSPQILAEYRAKLEEKVKELLAVAAIDESRIAAEVTIYADKICVDEEMVRLKSHIEATRAELLAGGSVGRKLDFIAQEMNREANTILSKSTDLAIADKAIALKTEIEKVREQIQNIE